MSHTRKHGCIAKVTYFTEGCIHDNEKDGVTPCMLVNRQVPIFYDITETDFDAVSISTQGI